MDTRSLVSKCVCSPEEALPPASLGRYGWTLPLVAAAGGIGVLSAGTLPYLVEAVQTTSWIAPGTAPLATSAGIVWGVNALAMAAILPATWLLQGVTLALVSRLGSAPLAIRRALGFTPWLWLPLALRMVVHGLYLLLGGTLVDNGLSFLVSRGQGLAPLSHFSWQFLWQWDPFFLGHLFLVGVVLHRSARSDMGRMVDGVILYGLITALGMALLATGPQPA